MSDPETTGRRAEREFRERFNLGGDRDPAEIERDLDAARDDLRATLEALEKRFSMDRIVEMTLGRVKAGGGRFAGNLGDAIADNPVAIVLASAGLGWMMLDRRRGSMARARDSMSGARDSMGEAAATARESIEQAHVSFDRMLEEQPLVLGAIGLAAGALVGALLPASETENRWLGEARQSAVRGVAEAAREEIASVSGERGSQRPSGPTH